jgi:hypothetical protein
MADDLRLLLAPAVERVPVEDDVVGQVRVVDTARRAVRHGRPVDVAFRDRVFRDGLLGLPDEQRVRRVCDDRPAAVGTNALRRGLEAKAVR